MPYILKAGYESGANPLGPIFWLEPRHATHHTAYWKSSDDGAIYQPILWVRRK